MSRSLRPSFVVTVSLSMAACSAKAPPSTARPMDLPPTGASSAPTAAPLAPTMSPPVGTTAVASNTTMPPATGTGGSFRSHPRDAAGHVIYRRATGVCFVEIIESERERRIRFDDVACAPVMSDPAYRLCDSGEIRRTNDGCLCARLGNPPKPTFAVTCPER